LNSTSTIVGIIAGTTIGASVFVLALAAIYLRWNKLWIFKNDDDYYGGHVPLADQNSSLPSRQSSLPSVPESITTTKKSTQQAFDRPKGGSGSGSANSSEGRQRQSSKIRQTDEELGFRKQEDLTYLGSGEISKRETEAQKQSLSFDYSLSDQGSSQDSNIIQKRRKQKQSLHRFLEDKRSEPSSLSSSRSLTTIANDFFYRSRNEEIQGENFFRTSSSASVTSRRKSKKGTPVVKGTGTFASAIANVPLEISSSNEEDIDPSLYFFKDGPNIPKSSSSSGSSSSGSRSRRKDDVDKMLKSESPPIQQINRINRISPRPRPATVVSAGSSRNSSSAMSSMGVEELIMNSPSGQISFFSDDDSALDKLGKSEIVELTAPPGVLGLVIDTVHGGIPTVFSVKEDSIISDKVKEGDRLISVNGVDTTELSARNVSKIITRFKDVDRTMIFFRQKSQSET
jgi:hypothetical protein